MGPRRLRAVLLAVAAAGLLAALALAALLAGGRKGSAPGSVVEPIPARERRETLDRAAERTRRAREGAARELEQVERGR